MFCVDDEMVYAARNNVKAIVSCQVEKGRPWTERGKYAGNR